jgi:uncharacterized Fe-S cluster-containing radical SAM superfamily enzyme
MKSFYQNERYKKFFKNLSSYEQQQEFIEIIGEAMQFGIAKLSFEFRKGKEVKDAKV